MLKFEKTLKENLHELKPYFAAQTTHISDFSLGYQFMWRKHLCMEYTFAAGCLILREFYAGKVYYYYPISQTGDPAEEAVAVALIEQFCREQNAQLQFTDVSKDKVGNLVLLGVQEVHVTNVRRWRDYLYRAEDFKTYAGGKYAGQRNHVNKFKKSFPGWQFVPYTKDDESELLGFLREYEAVQRRKHTFLANEEMDEVYALLPNIAPFGLLCGVMRVNGRIVGVSVGEHCGDMIVIHVEKALREYEGIYPCLAQEFAKMFCGEGINYLNRMDDAGDGGLRKSKLQYLPCALVDKFNVMPMRAIDTVSRIPTLKSERLTLAPVHDRDAKEYYRLASSVERNRYWGYDWREECPDSEPPAGWFLASARADFKERREMPFGIYFGKELVGEAVLHRFGYHSEAEVGVRVLPEAEGKGFAAEAVKCLTEYAFLSLGLETVEAKHFKENGRSGRMLERAGFRPNGSDETYCYYRKTPQM